MAQATKYWTAQQAAEALEVNVKTLYKELKENGGRIGGVLIAFQVGTRWKFIPHAVERVGRGELE